jgi:5-bromo-4-chloroindolyl phosphate hydrolysis protein
MISKAKPYKPNPSSKNSSIPKGALLYVFLVPLFISVILALLQTNIMAFIWNSIAFILFFVVLKLSKKGFIQEKEYLLATLTKAPKVPYKTISALLLGFATFFTAWIAGHEPFMTSLFLGLISTLGYYLYYGFDPKEDKLENLGNISAEFVIETIEEAKGKLNKIKENMTKIQDKILLEKLEVSMKKAEHILAVIQEDPKDIRVARKFLIVYIDGIAKVVDSYTTLDEKDIDEERKENLYALVDDLEDKFDKELERLKNNNLFDLDVNIDVLKEQIK